MNTQKDPRHAQKLAKQQARLRRIAKKNPDALSGREKAMCAWDVEFENFEVTRKPVSRKHEEEDEYADYA